MGIGEGTRGERRRGAVDEMICAVPREAQLLPQQSCYRLSRFPPEVRTAGRTVVRAEELPRTRL